jgi:intein/homing endonuclease
MEIHLEDLPEKEVYLKLKEDYRKLFFNKFLSRFKNRKMAIDAVGIKYNFYLWQYRTGARLCPLWVIKNIAKIICEDIKVVEQNIELLRGKGGRCIKFPNFPFLLDKKLARILGNLIGDGCISVDSRNCLRVFYTNLDDILINKFKRTVKEYFGNIQLGDSIGSRGQHIIYLPKIIGIIIRKIGCKTRSSSAEIPEIILNANLEIKSEFLRGLYDDDGFVILDEKGSNRVVGLASGSWNLVNHVKKILLVDFGIESLIIPSHESTYSLIIDNRADIIKFKEKIGFTSKFYKQILLEKLIKSYKRIISKKGKIAKLIIELLEKEGPLKTDEIARKLELKYHSTHSHLIKLKKLGILQSSYVKPIRNEKGQIKDNSCYLWHLQAR